MIFNNAEGTMSPSFQIGKNGIRIYQGNLDPSLSESVDSGDIWIDTSNNTVKIRDNTVWETVGGTIVDYGTIA